MTATPSMGVSKYFKVSEGEVKTCIIAAEMARRQDRRHGSHIFMPDYEFSDMSLDPYAKFNFEEGNNPKGYNAVHYPKKRLPCG